MGINIFSPACTRMSGLGGFLTRLHALKSLFVPTQNAEKNLRVLTNQAMKNRTARPRAIDTAAWRLGSSENRKNLSAAEITRPSRLRIVREFEPGVGTSFAGRMVISGRMADVCAELDRMAQPDVHPNRH